MNHESERTDVLVVGSANMDLVVRCKRFPKPGETVLGDGFATHPGGKGANQAVACGRLGGPVRFLGKMGRDAFRDELTASMRRDGIDLEALLVDEEAPTGVALIAVDGAGENQITVVSGSNMRLQADEVEACEDLFRQAAVVLLQLEVPLETVERAVMLGRRHGATVILNPAPARPLPDALLAGVDLLTPNETEAALLSGVAVEDRGSAERAAARLMERGVRCVLVTMGAAGALLVTPERSRLFPAHPVEAVDTTAAGDAFNGALAGALAEGHMLEDAVPFANAAAALAVTRPGAQPSMPTRAEIEAVRTGGESVVIRDSESRK